MLPIADAITSILSVLPRLPAEQVPLGQAAGRVLAEDLASPVDVPPWDDSAMDGYAVRGSDTVRGDVRLRLVGTVLAGQHRDELVGPGEAVAIMTGAPLPPGADAVVPVEDTDGAREGEVHVRVAVSPGTHVRPRGLDIRRGAPALTAGQVLSPAAVGLTASLGIPTLLVVRRPVVAVLSTGDELAAPGTPLGPGQRYSANNSTLAALLTDAGAQPLDAGTAPDVLDALVTRLQYCVEHADAVVTSGGVSMGERDLVRAAWEALGGRIDLWKVAIKPGKPLTVGTVDLDGEPVRLFGLAGNPTSAMANFLTFVRPWVLRSLGVERAFLPVVEAVLGEELRIRTDRPMLVRVRLHRGPAGEVVAASTGSQSSGVLTGMVRGHGFALVGPGEHVLPAGQRVQVQLFDPAGIHTSIPDYRWSP